MNCNLTVRELTLCVMHCLRHELCLSAHWLPFNSWRKRHADEKSWRSQFMMRQHQFIKKIPKIRDFFALGGIFFFFEAEEQAQKGFAVKGDEGVEITVLATQGSVENKAQGNKKQSQGKAPYPKEGYQDQQ